MYLLGHIGITAFITSMLFLPALGAVLGVLLPDLIDKGLFLIGAPCSRFIAHSIFFFPIVGLIGYAITRNKKFAIAVTLGVILHLVEDLNAHLPLLYPLKDYEFFSSCKVLGIKFTPFIIVTEIIGGMLLIYVYGFSRNFLQMRKAVWKFIRG